MAPADGTPGPVGVHDGARGGFQQSPHPPVVDAHHHLWDPADPGQGWLTTPEHAAIKRVFTADDLRQAAKGGADGRPLGASVVVQSIASLVETRALLAAAAADPLLAGVVGWVDLTGDVVGQLDALRSGPGGELLVGVRHLVQDEPDPAWLLREGTQQGLRALAGEGLTFDLLVRATQRAAAVEAARRVPDLRVVLDHAGKPDLRRSTSRGSSHDAFYSWVKQLRAFASDGATICKVSGLATQADADWCSSDLRTAWTVLLEAFGPERLAFGSDWPVCLLASSWQRWADTAADLSYELSTAERRAFFGGTAQRFYALSCPEETSMETTMTMTPGTHR